VSAAARVMMIGLDGFELSVAERLMAQERLPVLAELKAKGASVLLDHGVAKRTGLAWEHVSTGLAPDDAERWAAVDFDPRTYRVRQRPTWQRPFAASLDCRTVVFDAPYFDLAAAPDVGGMVHWGAHDPGVPPTANPPGLAAEIAGRFGPYPAEPWIYGFVWPSVERTRAMAVALERAVEVRGEISAWLFGERCPDWRLGMVVISEYHSAIEALWHGVDESHPLHGHPSAGPARLGVEAVYEASDRMIGRLMAQFPDTSFVLFNLHGMGANNSDAPSMALLAELLYRRQFGRVALDAPPADGVPLLGEDQTWDQFASAAMPRHMRQPGRWESRIRRLLPGADEAGLNWMPAARYRRFWPRMTAFALPSFYDGRIRINLKGREASGLVDPANYESACDEVEALLRQCRDSLSGESVVAEIERASRPLELDDSQSDMVVVWRGAPLGLAHPDLGTIGPLPYRRTGGHTGRHGVAYLAGAGIRPGSLPARSAFDVVPTMIEMLGLKPSRPLSGESFFAELRGQADASGFQEDAGKRLEA
jgi:predicted AlkP superfamily phosphohydrolase/phosphomutase